jgi:hypothetical protein
MLARRLGKVSLSIHMCCGHGGGFSCRRIQFTLDGLKLLIAERINRVSIFTIEGLLVKHVGVGILGAGWKDVESGVGGEIIVAS